MRDRLDKFGLITNRLPFPEMIIVVETGAVECLRFEQPIGAYIRYGNLSPPRLYAAARLGRTKLKIARRSEEGGLDIKNYCGRTRRQNSLPVPGRTGIVQLNE